MRVSTEKQNNERQMVELLRYGVEANNIYSDKLSGKNFNRPAWKRLRRRLKKGDVLVVKSLDRLGRDYHEIGEQWRFITTEIGADIKVLDMPLLDTGKQKDLIGTLISDLVLMLLSYVSEQERLFIKQRQAEGIALAKARGVKFGRPSKPKPPEFEIVYAQYRAHQMTGAQSAEYLQISYNAFLWLCKKEQNTH